ncbi:helix-turn-helix domain-containing protein [Streptomyces sporangiiformans]|uniref:Helix-turn-helix domain-containing protein n=1 Tax=Streptomyces sporangiiformans TaxID=2315329 RepID=A0A505DEF7_9ACTN|nr:helix-turn-helix domain-containing protein [Streptomyces sporangiiformans]TPQ18968.1 helix-turn-helix domain-containing protein [Streptomyces sporangiiformans]
MRDFPAEEIRAAREARGWDQAELARLISVGQQTVSRWERGESSPSGERLRRLRAALGLDDAVTPVRRPLLEELPFNRLDAYQFEAFSAALVSRLYPDAREVLPYGVSGDAQHGIDIRTETADGERIGFQCKKYEKFRPSLFLKAVAELDRDRARVDRCVLLLSTRASAAVVEACDKLDEWTIWDSRALSRKVDELPRDQAQALLDRFFPDMREEFLGVRTPSVWQTAEEAFPVSMANPVHSHEFRLVGRTNILESLAAFATSDSEPRIAVLTGVAGQGKSRLLRELARVSDRGYGRETRVLLPGPFTPDAFEYLPASDQLLVLVEDAHERSDDLAVVVGGILRARPRARVVIATRPYGRHVVQQALRAAHVDEREVPRWDLSALGSEDAFSLASEILGEGQEHAARVVAHVAADSPLLLVNAATSMRRGILDIRKLQTHSDVHKLLLDVFVQSALSQSSQPDDDRALLHAVAALQPVATDVPHFQNALSALLQMPFTRISPRLLRLEGTGILVRRGASVRIFPDLLGDVLLAEAAVNPHDGSPTEYLRHVQEYSDGDALANALLNAGRVEWQWNGRNPRRGSLLAPLWDALEAEFRQGGAYTRTNLLRLLLKIAPFQPQRVLDLVRWALANPTTEDDRPHEIDWVPGNYSQADVLREVPRVLEAVAVDLDEVRNVYDLLWSLGRDDQRPQNQNPDAPLRILLDLASYVPGKPLEYQEALLDAVSDWIEEAAPSPANRMPLALLDPLFSSTAEGRTVRGLTLTLSRYPVRAEAVAPVRRSAIKILIRQYASQDEGRAVVAAASLAEVLRDQNEDFEPYNIEFLQELGTLVAEKQPSPLVSLQTRRSLSWSIKYDRSPTHEMAQRVIEALPDRVEHRLALLLHTGPYDKALMPRSDDDESLESVQNFWEALRHTVLHELSGRPASEVATLLVSLVEAGHRVLAEHSEGVPAVLQDGMTGRPDLVPALLDRLAGAQEGVVRVVLPIVLRASFKQDMTRAVGSCRRLVTANRPAEVWAVTQALQEFIPETAVQEAGALELARSLASHTDPMVRAGVLSMAVSMLPNSKDTALQLLTSVPFGETGAVPHQVWWAFTMHGLLSWRDLTDSQREFFLAQCTALPALNDHTVQQFFVHLAEADADTAVGLLRARVERWEEAPERFDPLPFQWSVPLPFAHSPQRLDLLQSIRDWLARPREKPWRRELHAPELFWTIAGPADEQVLRLLLEPYETGDSNLVPAASPLLSKLPKSIVWDRVDLVATMLKTASRLSEDAFRRTGGNLHAAVFNGVRWGTPGKPYAEDIDISQRAKHIRAGLPRGSVVDRFYKALQDSAQRSIDQVSAEDLNDN